MNEVERRSNVGGDEWVLPQRLLRASADAAILNASLMAGVLVDYTSRMAVEEAAQYPPLLQRAVVGFALGALMMTGIALLVFSAAGLYTKTRAYRGRYKLLAVVQAVAVVFLAFGSLAYLLGDRLPFPSPMSLLIAGGLCALGMTGARAWAYVWGRSTEESDGTGTPSPTAHHRVLVRMQNAGTTGRLIDLAGAGAATVSKARWRLYSVLMREDRSPADTRVAFTHPDNFPEDCESFSFRFSRRWNLASLHRDPGFMDWRVNMNPHVRARLVVARMGQQTVGWALYSVDSSSNGFIVDLAVAAPEGSESAGFEGRIMDGLLLRSLAALRSAGAKSIRMWSNSDSPYERLIRRRAVRMGFIHLRRGESSVFLPLSNSDELQRVVRGYHSRLSTVGVSG